jgi:hypothetical protein
MKIESTLAIVKTQKVIDMILNIREMHKKKFDKIAMIYFQNTYYNLWVFLIYICKWFFRTLICLSTISYKNWVINITSQWMIQNEDFLKSEYFAEDLLKICLDLQDKAKQQAYVFIDIDIFDSIEHIIETEIITY